MEVSGRPSILSVLVYCMACGYVLYLLVNELNDRATVYVSRLLDDIAEQMEGPQC